MRPALLVLADDPATGVPGLTDDATAARSLLATTLDVGRQVRGVGRVLLFHPAEAEPELARAALGYRLWPQQGESPGDRWAHAFEQAVELGFEGGVVLGLTAANIAAERVDGVVEALEHHAGAVIPDQHGGIAVAGLAQPQPSLFAVGPVRNVDDLLGRARQQRIDITTLDHHEVLTERDVSRFVATAS